MTLKLNLLQEVSGWGEIPNPNIVNVEPIIERPNSFLMMGSFVNFASSIFKMDMRGFKLKGKGLKFVPIAS